VLTNEGGDRVKKFEFKLDKLLRYKDQLLESELAVLAGLNAEMKRADDRLKALTAKRLANRAELEEKQSSGAILPAACQIYFRYDNYLRAEITDAKRLIALIAAKIEKQIEVIKELRLETKSLELMKEAKLTSYRKEELKAAEQQMDEFVNTARVMRAARS
jgi:flagellar export protein FliJ